MQRLMTSDATTAFKRHTELQPNQKVKELGSQIKLLNNFGLILTLWSIICLFVARARRERGPYLIALLLVCLAFGLAAMA